MLKRDVILKAAPEKIDLSDEIRPLIHKLGIQDRSIRASRTPRGMIITFIAARSAEGTTTVARSFARAFCDETGKRTLLIETGEDSVVQADGIVDCLASGGTVAEAIVDAGSELFLAQWMSSPAMRGTSGRVLQDKSFWQMLSKNFSLIIIDAPSLQETSTGIVFAQASHQTFVVVEAETTRKEVAANLCSTLLRANAKIAGAILNKRKFYIPERLYNCL